MSELSRRMNRAVVSAAWRLKGLRVNKAYETLMARNNWSAEQWRAYQAEQIRQLVRHCYEHVPFYRERFDALKLRPEDVKGVEDLPKVPLLRKADIRENAEKMLATNFDRSKIKTAHTTGSTGSPLTFHFEPARSELIMAGLWRNYSRCGWVPGEKIAAIWGVRAGQTSMPAWKWALRDRLSGILHLNAWEPNPEEFRRWLDVFRRQKPTVIVCYASLGVRFAQWLTERDERVEGIKGVYTTSEKLYDPQRKAIEGAFGCQVYDFYGSREVAHISCQCGSGSMHINPDMVVPEAGERDEAGNSPLYVTGFVGRAMPFLRYDLGDTGKLEEGSCTCGLHTPLMSLAIARRSDYFTMPCRDKYPSLYFILRMYAPGFEGVELFQYHQTAPEHIRLSIVKNERFTDETAALVESLKKEVEGHIKGEAELEVVYVDSIPQEKTGKHLYARSDVKD